MKKVNFSLFFPIFFFIYPINVCSNYADYARQWCQTYVYDASGRLRVSSADFDALRELIQYSADRSALSLKAQDISLQMLGIFWQVRENLLRTRLNPSHERPHRIERSMCPDLNAYWDVIEEQERCAQRYVACVESTVNGTLLVHGSAKDAVNDMRAQARVYMIDALADVKAQLGVLYEIAFHKSYELDLHSDDFDEISRGLNIGDFILSYIPNLAMQGFVQADTAHNVISAEGWQMLEKIQRVGDQVWHAIESARYAFYVALLNELDRHK